MGGWADPGSACRSALDYLSSHEGRPSDIMDTSVRKREPAGSLSQVHLVLMSRVKERLSPADPGLRSSERRHPSRRRDLQGRA